jgi:hypothetical protein
VKNYIAEIIDLTGDSYLNPVGGIYVDGSTHQRSLNSINVIGTHHDATPRPHDYDSVARYKQEAREHYNRLGPGLQYHYKIDNTGQIFYIRPLTTWLYAVGTEANTRGVWICLDGYFHPDVNQHATREQYEAHAQLVIYLMTQRPDIPNLVFPNIAPHSSFSSTACCGDTLRPYVLQIDDEATANNIPGDAVYDWPSLQPTPTQPPVVVTPPAPTPSAPALVQDKTFKPAAYITQVKSHLDGLETGKRLLDYDPGAKFDFVARFTRGTASWLLTPYAISAHEQGKRELAGVPEKDLLLAQVPGSVPTPPSPADPVQQPPVVVTPPTPTPAEQDHEKRISALEALVQKIVSFLDSIFKGWKSNQ